MNAVRVPVRWPVVGPSTLDGLHEGNITRRVGQRRGGPYGPAVQDEKGPLVTSLFLVVGASLKAPNFQVKIVDEMPAVVLYWGGCIWGQC